MENNQPIKHVVRTRLMQVSGNVNFRYLVWKQDEQHFFKVVGPKVQIVKIGINSKAGY